MGLVEPRQSWFHGRMHVSLTALGRAVAILTSGALALGLVGGACASTVAPAEAPAPAATSAPEVEVAVVPEATAAPEGTSAEATEPSPAKTVFYVYRRFKGDPQLMLTRVTKKPDGLKLDFVFASTSATAMMIKISPAGDPNAMFVELPDGRRLEFKSSEGIAVKPERDRIEAGEKQRFSLTFDPLPDGETKFDLYEGEGAKNAPPGQGQFWLFRNIQLK